MYCTFGNVHFYFSIISLVAVHGGEKLMFIKHTTLTSCSAVNTTYIYNVGHIHEQF